MYFDVINIVIRMVLIEVNREPITCSSIPLAIFLLAVILDTLFSEVGRVQ